MASQTVEEEPEWQSPGPTPQALRRALSGDPGGAVSSQGEGSSGTGRS